MTWNLSSIIRRWFRPTRQRPIRKNRSFRPRLETLESRLAPANVSVLSFHNDSGLTGANLQETNLTPTNVNSTNFGKLAGAAVDGYVYATPLYVAGLMINGAPHNVAYVATENDSLYAFDVVSNPASPTGVTLTQLWQHAFYSGGPMGPTTSGITSVPNSDVGTGDIVPTIGITGSPVIDATSNTLYVVAKTKEVRADGNHYVQTLHALDLVTGADKFITTGNGGYIIGDSKGDGFANQTTSIVVAGAGADTSGGANPQIAFNAFRENERSSLILLNGRVYIPWASHGDNGPYHGWVVGFNETTLQPEKIFNTTPNTRAGGIWQSEGALSTDGTFLYGVTGNTFGSTTFPGFDPAHGDYGETALKLDPSGPGTAITVASYFTPNEWQVLDNNDTDFGSGGMMLLPAAVGSAAHPNLGVAVGKSGKIYLLDTTPGHSMGQNVPAGQADQVVQTITAGPGGVWGTPAFYQDGPNTGLIYYHGSGVDTRAFRITNGVITPASPAFDSNQTFGFPGAQPIISANGQNGSSAVDWELQVDNYGSQGLATLHAYAADPSSGNVLTELYNSNQAGARDQFGGSVKFTSVTVTNGMVFAGSEFNFSVFGLFPTHAAAPAAPTNLSGTGTSPSAITLSWTNPTPNTATGIKIFRSVGNDTNFTLLTTASAFATSFTDTGLTSGQVYFYKIAATNQVGDSAQTPEIQATPLLAPPVLATTNVTSVSVALQWTRPPVANDHYSIERSRTADFASVTTIASNIAGTTLSFTDTDPALVSQPGQYFYRVRAFGNAAGTISVVSNSVGVKVGPSAGVINYGPPNGFPTPPAPAPFDVQANGSAQFAETTLRLTNAVNQTGSAFSTSEENILNWTTTFTVRLHEGTQPNYANGFTFVIQAGAASALGQGLTGLGYQGISNSVALTFDTFTNGFFQNGGAGSVGLFVNGDNPGGTPGTGETRIALNSSQVNLNSQSSKVITLSYAYNAANPGASVLHEVITDPDHPATPFTHDYTVDIPSLLGTAQSGNTIAYVGFTGSTGTQNLWELQDITNWVYTPNAPAAPHGLTVISAATSNILNWKTTSADDGPAPAGYYVERSTSQTSGFTRITTLGPGTSTFTDSGLTNPQQYYYRVQQFNHNGTGGAELDSGYSNVATGAAINVNFPSFPNGNGFTTNSFPGLATINEFPGTPPVLRLTDGNGNEGNSAWYNTAIGTGAFTTTFKLQDHPNAGAADSLLFVIQNDPGGATGGGAGLNAVGHGGGAGGYGPDDALNPPMILNSIGIKFDLYSGGSHSATTGFFMNGQYPGTSHDNGADVPLAPINLGSTDPMLVTITYDGATTLTENVTDTVTSATFSHTYTMPQTLAQIVGTTGFAGFTGGTGGETATQDILSWTGQFAQAPPAANHFTAGAVPTSITAGGSTQVTVSVIDQYGNPFPTYTGTVHFTSNDPQVSAGSGLPADYTFTTADAGTHTFTVTLKTSGADTVTATDTAHSGISGTAGVTVNPGTTVALAVAGVPPVVAQGTTNSFTVRAVDAFGNTTPGYLGSIIFTSSDMQANLPGPYSFVAADNGSHTFAVTFNTTGVQSITATDTGTSRFTGTESGISVQQAGVVIINYPNGFADQSNVTINGSASFAEAANVFSAHQDVGTTGDPSSTGNATFNNGTYTLTASGSDIWDPSDHFQYDYKSLTGDGTIIARVVNPEVAPDFWTKAGLMFRSDLTATSANDFMMYTPNTGHQEPIQQWRDVAGGASGDTGNHGTATTPNVPVPIWLRMDRVGNTFTGYWATDAGGHPGTWSVMTTHTTVMPSTVFVGLALTAHNNGAMATATFDHVSVTGNPPPVARLTDGGGGEAGSLFYNTPVGPGAFSTTFTLRDSGNPSADSLSFVLQDDPRGLKALGNGGGNGGYGDTSGGNHQITHSIAIKFDLWTNNTHVPTTGLFTNGQSPSTSDQNPVGSQDIALTPVSLATGDPIQVTITYDGSSNLVEMVTDTVTHATFTHTYTNVNLAQLFGGNAAYAGFTAGTGGATSIQDIVNWTGTFQQADTVVLNFPNFANNSNLTANTNTQNPPLNVFPPTPGAVSIAYEPSFNTHTGLVTNGSASFAGTPAAMQLTDGGGGEAGSVWSTTPVFAGSFTTTFVLQDNVGGSADSMSFVIQADPRGTTALGGGGGQGGYAGIAKSIAVKFDLWTNNTHVPTTGLFFNGQSPSTSDQNPVGSQDVALPDNILASGDPNLVTLSYNGTTLTETVLDINTLATFSHTYTLNLAQFLGSGPALVGFTGGTGGATSIQKILRWTGTFTGAPSAMQLTDNRGNEATSVFDNTPVGLLGPFNTTFTLLDTPTGSADSLSFVMQADARGTTALGAAGGGGGYAGITNSIAIKFDLWTNGTHVPTTGLYTNGQSPASPNPQDITLTGFPDLGSGHPITVNIMYNGGSQLTETVTDTVTHATFTHTYAINLAQVMGANSAYVGFTAGTGGVASTQTIQNWTGTFAPAEPTKFIVSAPASVAEGTPFQVTVTAVDRNNNLIPGYFGTIHSVSSDPAAILPPNYLYVISDNGSRTFTVTLNTSGTQTLTVNDTNLPTLAGTASVNATLDYSNGFANHNNDLTANGSATFVSNVGNGPVGIFAGNQDLGTQGDPGPAGTATFANGTYTLAASGSDIWNTNDHFHYAYESLTGDGEIIARMINPESTADYWTKAGVMIRQDLNTGSPNEFMAYTPNTTHQEPVQQWRDGYNQGSGDTGNHPPNNGNFGQPVPIWLRLVRIGNNFSGYWAVDVNGSPGAWQLMTTHTTVMPTTVFVGLALTAHNNPATATATFDHVQVIGATSTLTPTTVARLTDGGGTEAGSMFTKTKVSDTSFTTTFTFQNHSVTGSGDSLLFVLQNDPRGVAAVGRAGGGGGYDGIANSIGVKFDFYSHGAHNALTGLFLNGKLPDSGGLLGGDVTVPNINFASGDPIKVTLIYNGTTLTENILDTVTGVTFTHDYLVNISQVVGGNTAYAGFTAGTGGDTAVMDVQSWTYTPTSVPAVASLTVSVATSPNLVNNGGFETGNYTGWTRSGDTSADSVITGTADNVTIHSGTHASRLGPNNLVFLTQTLATTAGASYNLDFWLSNPIGGGGTEWLVKEGATGTTLTTLTDVHNAPRFNYTHFTFTFTATSSSTDLQFGFAHPPDWFYLDDVSVTPVALTAGANAFATVTALDAGGHQVAYNGTVHITSTDPLIPDFGTYTFTAADNGQHVFTGTLATVGTQTVTFRDVANNSLVASASQAVVAAAASNFTVSEFPSPIGSGTPGAFLVTAKDPFGNTATTYRGTVRLTSSDPRALLPVTTYTFTAGDNGQHAFSAILRTLGTESITATDSATASIHGSESVVVTPASFQVTGFPSEVTAGDTDSFTVSAADFFGNAVPSFLGTVHLTSSDPTAIITDGDGTPLTGNNYTFTTTDLGSHTFLATLATAGTQSLSVAQTDVPNSPAQGTESGILVDPAATSIFTVTGFPSSVTAGTHGTFTVTAKDAFGNTTPGYTGTVTFGSSDPAAVFNPTSYTFLPSDHGVHTFTNGATLDTAGTQTITATDSTNNISGSSPNIVVNPAAASVLLVTSPYPSPDTAGTANTITVTAFDTFGNVATGYRGVVHVSTNDPLVAAFDYTFTAGDAGAHAFSITLKTAGANQSITAKDNANASLTVTQPGIEVDPAAATKLVVSGFPSPAAAGTTSAWTVKAEDPFNNVDTNYGGTISLTSTDASATFTDNDGSALVGGNSYTFTSGDAGTHTFLATLVTAGTRSITATDTVTASITGSQTGIVLNPAAPSQIVVSSPYPSTVTAGTAHTITVAVEDAFGNVVTGYRGTVHVSSSDASLAPFNYTFTAGDAGTHTFSITLKTAGSQSISFADNTANIAGAQNGITVNPAAFAGFQVTGYPSSVNAGTLNSFTVTAVDAFGNTVTNYHGTIIFSSDDTGAVFADNDGTPLPSNSYTFTPGDGGSHTFQASFHAPGTHHIRGIDSVFTNLFGEQDGIVVH
jgi:hypothetical protein